MTEPVRNNGGKWWKTPHGLAAGATIIAMVAGFIWSMWQAAYVREKQLWNLNVRIEALESRGVAAIGNANTRFERMEQALSQQSDQVNYLERKIDHLEFAIRDMKEERGQKYEAERFSKPQ